MTPGSRPALPAYLSEEPDYVVPMLVAEVPEAEALYRDTMEQTWQAIGTLRSRGVAEEHAAYLLPNAVAIRFTESADLLNLHHKFAMRLCYNAQEEIWRASLDETLQIREVNPRIGPWLLPPCTLRHLATVRPVCPKGNASAASSSGSRTRHATSASLSQSELLNSLKSGLEARRRRRCRCLRNRA
jgi:thymidylate synthase ThyX